MKRIFAAIALTLTPAMSAIAQAATATSVVVAWTAAVYPVGTPNCSATVTTNCALGQTLTVLPPSGVAIIFPPCTATLTTGCLTPSTTWYTCTPPAPLANGTYSFSVVTNAIGSTATTPLASLPSSTTKVYSGAPLTVAPAPGPLTITFQ